jgi:hypothetical protein
MVSFVLAIPTYWTHPEGTGGEDLIFDHPSPLNSAGTLRRTLESLIPLVNPDIVVAVVAAAAAPELDSRVEARVREIIASPPLPYPVVFFAPSHLAVLRDLVQRQGGEKWGSLISLAGYGAIRNLTLVLANLLGAEALVSLDDDEVIEEADFFQRIAGDLEELGRRSPIFGLAGLYVNPDGRIPAPEPTAPWAQFWPKLRCMNQTFAGLMAGEDPMPPTPLALGGNMVLPAGLFRRLPFDPLIPRGEDVDYVVNARMWGIPFFCDPKLRVRHLPPAKPHPTWLRFRQDLLRFAYARRKLRQQEPGPTMVRVSPLDLTPYPGRFLGDDLEDMAHRSHTVLALEYLAAGEAAAAGETLLNLRLLQEESDNPANAFAAYLDFTQRWQALQTWLADPEAAARVRQALWG